MTTASSIPPELLLEIFEWATFYPDAYTTAYKPFCTTAFSEAQPTCRDTDISYSLALVCRLWHALVTEFLYRDVRIGYCQSALKGALCDKQGYGRFGMLFLYLASRNVPTNLVQSVERFCLSNIRALLHGVQRRYLP